MNNLTLKQLNDECDLHKDNPLRSQLAQIRKREFIQKQTTNDIKEYKIYEPQQIIKIPNYFISPKKIIDINNMGHGEDHERDIPVNNIDKTEKYNTHYIRVSMHIPNAWLYDYKVIPISAPNNDQKINTRTCMCLIDINSIPTCHITLNDKYGTISLYCEDKILKIITIQFPYNNSMKNIVDGHVIQCRIL